MQNRRREFIIGAVSQRARIQTLLHSNLLSSLTEHHFEFLTSKSCPSSCICRPSVAGLVSSGDPPTCPLLHPEHWPGCSSVARSAVRVADAEEEGQSFSFCPPATVTTESSGALTVDTWTWCLPSAGISSSCCQQQEGRPSGMGGAEGAHPYLAVFEVAGLGKESQILDGDNGSWSLFFLVVTI